MTAALLDYATELTNLMFCNNLPIDQLCAIVIVKIFQYVSDNPSTRALSFSRSGAQLAV